MAPSASMQADRDMLSIALASVGRDRDAAAELLDSFVTEHPASSWTPSVRVSLGMYYFHGSRYTKALEHLEAAWEATQNYQAGPGKRTADIALAYWTRLLAQLGRLEDLAVILGETEGRTLDSGPLSQKLLRTKEMYGMMRSHPGASYRCGWAALNYLDGAVLHRSLDPARAGQLYKEANLYDSCSLKTLLNLGLQEQWPLAAVERPTGVTALPVPSVAHLTVGHYVTLLHDQGAMIMLYDPISGIRRVRRETLNAEASGRFLLPLGQVPAGWRTLSADEAAATLGRSGGSIGFGGWLDTLESLLFDTCSSPAGLANGNGGNGNGGGGGSRIVAAYSAPAGGGCSSCGSAGATGMTSWRVTEPDINLWLIDTPISCRPACGPEVGLKLFFQQHNETAGFNAYIPSFGAGWSCSWLGWVEAGGYVLSYGGPVTVMLPGGGQLTFNFAEGQTTATDYYYNSHLTVNTNGSTVTGFTLDLPDGRRFVFQQQSSAEYDWFFVSSAADSQGFTTLFSYAEIYDQYHDDLGIQLTTVADQTGQPLYTLGYTSFDALYSSVVTSVTDRFGRSAQLTYTDQQGPPPLLSQIQDAAGMASSITYDLNNDQNNGFPTALTTPYGTTEFAYQGGDGETRWISVSEPNGGRQIYAFKSNCSTLWSGASWMPALVSPSLVPGNLPAGTILDTSPQLLDSFHWDQNQSQNLPAEPVNLSVLTSNQMNTARMRHWLTYNYFGDDNNTYWVADLGLSFEAAPSPDAAGSNLGQITFYSHAGEAPGGGQGTQIEPSLVARLLPDGSTWYESYQRNSFGLATSKTTTYGTGNPAPTRTYTYTIAANGQDLAAIYLPGNLLSASFTYNSAHEILTATRYPDGVTPYTDTWTYNAQGQPQTLVTAGGLTRTYTYNASSGTYNGYLSGIADQPTGRTESFTWTNGNVATHTDPRGLTLTNTYDGINRITEVDYPAHDGIAASSLHYSYSLLPGQGFNTGNTALPILDLAGKEDRLNNWTYYGLDQIRRITSVQDPLGHTTTYTYCGCGSPETVTDARNYSTTYTYNNAGWKTAVTYADNTTESYGYDAHGRLTTRSDALGTRTYTYNNKSLLATITSAYGTVRSLVYDVYDNPASDTDANGVTVTKTFDLLTRPLTRSIPGQNTEVFQYSDLGVTNYTGPDGNVTKYAYDTAGRKTSDTTPKNETTSYGYDIADDLLTLTDGRNNQTAWTYDIEGLARTKTYPGQSFANLKYTYDANQRLATREFCVSAYGGSTTTYTYDNAGNLTFIRHPSGTNVTFTYNPVNKVATMATTGLGTTTFAYTPAELLASEGGLWASDTVSLTYHPSVPGLRAGLTAQQPSGTWSQTYAYDAARRLQTLASPAGTFTYTYLGPGTVWTNLALPNTAAITNGYDSAARLLTTALINSSAVPINEHVYLYDTAGRRQKQTLIDGSYTTYSYDNDSQLGGSLGYTAGGSPVASQQLGFTYDAGFNMNTESVNGAPTTYTVNSLNELTAEGATAFTYDANGNRATSSAQNLTYTYDEEQRLALVSDNVNHTFQTAFVYDGLGRLRQRFESVWASTGGGGNGPQNSQPDVMGGNYQWMPLYSISYIYDGKRVIQERDVNNTPLVGYTRGNDLGGSLEGAGGIGGLLARSYGYSGGNWSAHSYYHADGNGNATYLANSSQGLAASYRYDPYGNTIASSGTLAATNVYRFSSKECHVDSGMYYYLYRFYDPAAQRWLNRDPIEESGGINLYAIVGNDPLDFADASGLTITIVGDPAPVTQSLQYLVQAPQVTDLLNDLVTSPYNYRVVINHNNNDSYDPRTRTVNWDPNSGLHTRRGGDQTPALGLCHELGHARGPRWWHNLLHLIRSKYYDNYEERRVIKYIENPIANTLGESPRSDHRGLPYYVPTPTSR